MGRAEVSEVVAPPTPATVLPCATHSGPDLCPRLGPLGDRDQGPEFAAEVVGALTEDGEVLPGLRTKVPGRLSGVQAQLADPLRQVVASLDGQQEAHLVVAGVGLWARLAELDTPGGDEILWNAHGSIPPRVEFAHQIYTITSEKVNLNNN